MVIYYAITSYHILEVWLHKLIFHSSERALLIIPSFITDKFPDILEKMPKSAFEAVYFVPSLNIPNSLSNEKRDMEICTHFNKYLDFSEIKKASEINVAGGHFYFPHWLILNCIHFNFFEDASGCLSNPELVMKSVRIQDQVRFNVTYEDGMFTGDNPYVLKCYCNMEAQINGYTNLKAEDFNVIKALSDIKEQERNEILTFFGVPKGLSFSGNSVMIMSQHFANMETMSLEKQAVLYQMTVDYYFRDYDIFIKAHPDDLLYYEYLIHNCKVIREKFPSELLPFISNDKASVIATISSTSIASLKNGYNVCIQFDQHYEESFLDNHKYYLAVSICNLFPNLEIKTIGVNESQCRNMIRCVNCKIKQDKNKNGYIYIVDRITSEECKKLISATRVNDIIIFLNTEKSFSFYENFDHKIFQTIIPKEIRIGAINNEECSDIAHEFVYIFSKSETTRESVKKMHYVKELLNSGIETKVPESMDKDIQIAALKGILEATERRLLFYIKKEKEEANNKNMSENQTKHSEK